jgi:archaellum biogenesis ATPase FlaH
MVKNYNKTSLNTTNLKELLRRDFEDNQWVIKRLIPFPGITIISGSPGSYKTWLTQAIAISVAEGKPFLGKFRVPNPGKVLFIDKENHLKLIKKRFQMLNSSSERIIYSTDQEWRIDKSTDISCLINSIEKINPQLVVFDSLLRIHRKDENSASEMSEVFEGLNKVKNTDTAILLTHHHRKSYSNQPSGKTEQMRGSSDILAAIDSHIAVEPKSGGSKLLFHQNKLRQDTAIEPFEVNVQTEKNDEQEVLRGFDFAGQHSFGTSRSEEVAKQLPDVVAEYFDQKNSDSFIKTAEIMELLNDEFGEDAVRKGLKQAVASKENPLSKMKKSDLPENIDKRGSFYSLDQSNARTS